MIVSYRAAACVPTLSRERAGLPLLVCRQRNSGGSLMRDTKGIASNSRQPLLAEVRTGSGMRRGGLASWDSQLDCCQRLPDPALLALASERRFSSRRLDADSLECGVTDCG